MLEEHFPTLHHYATIVLPPLAGFVAGTAVTYFLLTSLVRMTERNCKEAYELLQANEKLHYVIEQQLQQYEKLGKDNGN